MVEVKDHDQYVIKVHGSGRLTTRNRKFLKKIVPYSSDPPLNTSTPSLLPDPAPVPPAEALGELPQPAAELDDTRAVPTQPLQPEGPVEQQPRRSSRVKHAPDRLNIETTRGQSYESAACYQHGLHVSQCLHHLHPVRPGGEGINDDGRRLSSR